MTSRTADDAARLTRWLRAYLVYCLQTATALRAENRAPVLCERLEQEASEVADYLDTLDNSHG